jgi:hypothetical protein
MKAGVDKIVRVGTGFGTMLGGAVETPTTALVVCRNVVTLRS